jgi:prophage maintenance system killer protein
MPHAFLSYVRENAATVDRLASDLTARGVLVWLDRERIMPGQRWRDAIRDGIRSGDVFIACFSAEYLARDRSYMNEELTLAIEELRQRPMNHSWFIPVSLDGSSIPARAIGPGETINDLQWVNLASDWNRGVDMIAKTITGRRGTVSGAPMVAPTEPATRTKVLGGAERPAKKKSKAHIRYLTVQDVTELHKAICMTFGDAAYGGVIESQFGLVNAVQRPQVTLLGRDAYPTFADKASALVFALLQARPFKRGNRRVALAALVAFCALNDLDVDTDLLDERSAETLIKRTSTYRDLGIPPENIFRELRETFDRVIVAGR